MSQEKLNGTIRRFIRINGKRITARFSSKADADKWYALKLREKRLVESGVQKERESITFGKYAAEWLELRKAHGGPNSSLETDLRRLRLHVLPEMGQRKFDKILRSEWDEYFDTLVSKKGLSTATRNRVHALVQKMYQDALRKDYVIANPITGIPKASEGNEGFSFWETKEECERYLYFAEKELLQFWIFASISLNAGTRIGETLALRHRDLDLVNKRLHIWQTYEQCSGKIVQRTKAGDSRWIGMNDDLISAISSLRSKYPRLEKGDHVVYWSDRDRWAERDRIDFQRPLPPFSVRRIHKRVCKKAGLRHIRIHDLRHTFASHFVMNGGNLLDLQRILGHSTFSMTQKYAHLAPGHLESKANVVSFSGNNSVVLSIQGSK